jgi:hypothetical protein
MRVTQHYTLVSASCVCVHRDGDVGCVETVMVMRPMFTWVSAVGFYPAAVRLYLDYIWAVPGLERVDRRQASWDCEPGKVQVVSTTRHRLKIVKTRLDLPATYIHKRVN